MVPIYPETKTSTDFPLIKMRLVELAHSKIKEFIRPGDLCIDATAGNGYDTLFLARQISPFGKVYAVDIQKLSIEQTVKRLNSHGFDEILRTFHGSHTKIRNLLDKSEHGKVSAIMFNLGYLPGGDHAITTTTEDTIFALNEAYVILRQGGVITALCYRGHSEGTKETKKVFELCKEKKWDVEVVEGSSNPQSPVLILIKKTRMD